MSDYNDGGIGDGMAGDDHNLEAFMREVRGGTSDPKDGFPVFEGDASSPEPTGLLYDPVTREVTLPPKMAKAVMEQFDNDPDVQRRREDAIQHVGERAVDRLRQESRWN